MIESTNISKTERCMFCGKNTATQLCDMPKFISHKTLIKQIVQTCDNKMCKECALQYREFEYCPTCTSEMIVAVMRKPQKQQKPKNPCWVDFEKGLHTECHYSYDKDCRECEKLQ